MTDEELRSSWPDLGALVTELRGFDRALADRLVDAVQYSSTSGETPSGVQAWKRVMADVGRAFGRPPFLEWLTSLFRKNK